VGAGGLGDLILTAFSTHCTLLAFNLTVLEGEKMAQSKGNWLGRIFKFP